MNSDQCETLRTIFAEQGIDAVPRPPLANGAEVRFFGIRARGEFNSQQITNIVGRVVTGAVFTSENNGYHSFVDPTIPGPEVTLNS